MWRKLGEWPIRDGYRAIVGRRYRLPSGLEHEFEIKLEGETVAVVAFTPAQEVVLVREFRPGPEAELLELPGGAIDAGEGPVEAARRELLEETGYEAVVEHVAVAFDCAYSTRRRHVCVGRDARRVAEPTPDDEESPVVELLSLDAFRAHLRGGQLTDVALGYLALDALGLL
jgi:ADP-ribose pyrophosphatase